MAIPTVYNDSALALYIVGELGDVAAALDWDGPSGPVVLAVQGATRAYGGITQPSEATNMALIEALARREGWKRAVGSLAARFDFQTDDQRFQRSQMHAMAKAALEMAERDADALGTAASTIDRYRVRYPEDPYAVLPDELRTA